MKTTQIKYRQWTNTEWRYWGFIDGIFVAPIQGIEDSYQLLPFPDKNGVEIYEGDILKGRLGVILGFVEYGQYKTKAASKHDRPKNHIGWFIKKQFEKLSLEQEEWYINPTNYTPFRGSYLEVIGNIKENPELLKKLNVNVCKDFLMDGLME